MGCRSEGVSLKSIRLRLYIYIRTLIQSHGRINHQTLDVVSTPAPPENFHRRKYSPGRTLVFDTLGRIVSPKINAPLIYHRFSPSFRPTLPVTRNEPGSYGDSFGRQISGRPHNAPSGQNIPQICDSNLTIPV